MRAGIRGVQFQSPLQRRSGQAKALIGKIVQLGCGLEHALIGIQTVRGPVSDTLYPDIPEARFK